MAAHERTFSGDFRKFFLRGLAVLLPSVLTLWIVVQAYFFVDRSVAEPINAGLRSIVLETAPRLFDDEQLPAWFIVRENQVAQMRAERTRMAQREITETEMRNQIRARNLREWWDDHWYTRFIGLFVAILLIYLAGRLLGGYIGRRLYARVEGFLTRLPVFKQVYPHVKQVVDFLMGQGQERIKFNRVVLVEYPRKGIWTVGLMTGKSMRNIEAEIGSNSVTVFIPSSPTPFTGYTITVPETEVFDLPISIDEALRFVISGGVLIPDRQQLPDDPNRTVNAAELLSRATPPASPLDPDADPDAGAGKGD
ncbi:MAG: DUF502 domain-containing protein [Phycisphaerales bacterium]